VDKTVWAILFFGSAAYRAAEQKKGRLGAKELLLQAVMQLKGKDYWGREQGLKTKKQLNEIRELRGGGGKKRF